MVSRARSTDANQADIISALRDVGASVRTLQMEASGLPDLLVGYRGRNYLVEVKTEEGTRTPDQIDFWETWQGQTAICRTIAEALAVLGIETQHAAPAPELTNAEQIARWQGNAAQQTVVWGKTWQRKRKW